MSLDYFGESAKQWLILKSLINYSDSRLNKQFWFICDNTHLVSY